MSSNNSNNNVSSSNSVGPSIPAEENPEEISAGIEGELERTPPGSDLETASSSNEAEPSNGFSQSEHPVFSLRRALITPRREMGNMPALCEEVITNGAILPQRIYDTTIPVRYTSLTAALEAFNLSGPRSVCTKL